MITKAVLCMFALLTMAASCPVSADGLPDRNLYTIYHIEDQSVTFTVCGRLRGNTGCSAQGQLTSFSKVCAVMESAPVYSGRSEKRFVYVLDKGATNSDQLTLSVYKRIDLLKTIDVVMVKLLQRISLGLQAGPNTVCAMAANKVVLFAGLIGSSSPVAVDLRSFSVSLLNFVGTASAISADARGYVTVSGTGQFFVVAPNDKLLEDGGSTGPGNMVGVYNGYLRN